ncbi:nucleotidyl transferase AbiEii/AbiGii toxin family protein [Myxococcota bacterium]|nr:nucleotidyl transferase AbiEii/AbiGii toxin family protein [Myxococcota bacterium]
MIDRFSEDLDLRIDTGRATGVADPVLPWEDPNNKARRRRGALERDRWFDALAGALDVPDCTVRRNRLGSDEYVRSAWIEVVYPKSTGDPPVGLRPFILLEVGRARVVPSVERDLSSWLHDDLAERGQVAEFVDNRPTAVRCVHPMLTCLEKLEAIARRFEHGKAAPDFVRHYEDAARIVERRGSLPDLGMLPYDLAARLAVEDHKPMPAPTHPAFNPDAGPRWQDLAAAWGEIGPMYWGPRLSLDEATSVLRPFLTELRTRTGT